MISRYTRPEMGRIWSEENSFQKWLDVEILAAEGLARMGRVPQAAISRIRRKARLNVKRIRAIEAEVKHETIAFLSAIAETIGDDARYLHVGMTSSDVMDTALAIQFKEASTILEQDIKDLMSVLRRQAQKYKWTVMIGRTHGVHAEPITFGLKLAIWYQEMERHRSRFRHAVEDICVGKISGAVGTFAQIPPQIEAYVCRKSGLKPAPVSNQIVQRDRHAFYFSTLALIASSLEKFAIEIRHLQRTEVQEAEEPFTEGQKGSSAMPHKRNPILSENVSGLARLMRSYAHAAMENIPLWHERDISHSSVERVILPDSSLLAYYVLRTADRLVTALQVSPERMLANLWSSHGLVFSQPVLLALVAGGLSRDAAYRIVQEDAMRAWDEGVSFRSLLEKDERVTIGPDALDEAFSLERSLRHIGAVFDALEAVEAPGTGRDGPGAGAA